MTDWPFGCLLSYLACEICFKALTHREIFHWVWPDVGIKSSPNVSKSCAKYSHSSFFSKVKLSRIASNITNYLSTFVSRFLIKKFKNCPNWSHWLISQRSKATLKAILWSQLLSIKTQPKLFSLWNRKVSR